MKYELSSIAEEMKCSEYAHARKESARQKTRQLRPHFAAYLELLPKAWHICLRVHTDVENNALGKSL